MGLLIGIDLDNTGANFNKLCHERLRSEHPEIDWPDPATHTKPYYHDNYPPKLQTYIFAIMNRPGFFLDLEPFEFFPEAVHELLACGHDVAICSKPLASNPTCADDKLKWVRRHLDCATQKISSHRTFLVADKTRFHCDILIDDMPEIRGIIEKPPWEHVLMDHLYNRDVANKRRLAHWSQWRQIIET